MPPLEQQEAIPHPPGPIHPCASCEPGVAKMMRPSVCRRGHRQIRLMTREKCSRSVRPERARDPSRVASVRATAVPMSDKVWPIQGTAGTVAERLAGSLQVRTYIMSCERVGNFAVGSVAVSRKTSAPTKGFGAGGTAQRGNELGQPARALRSSPHRFGQVGKADDRGRHFPAHEP